MDILGELAKILSKSEMVARELIEQKKSSPFIEYNLADSGGTKNKIYKSDNIEAIKDLLDKGYRGKLDLIYIDPPFFTEKNFKNRTQLVKNNKEEAIDVLAYRDTWTGGFLDYLEMLTIRLYMMKALLSKEGTIYVHLDYRTVHYVKIIMDYIFGADRFLNEIIWSYKSGGASRKHYSRKHDNILVYSKTENYIFNPQKEKSYNRGYKPYRFKGVKEYEDQKGWYTLVNLRDVWDINVIGRTSRERVGYGTQKPEELLERIILSSSRTGSLIGDFFAGSGTTAIVAERNKRRWIVSDIGDPAILTIKKRLWDLGQASYTLLDKEPAVDSDLVEINKSLKISGDKLLIHLKLGKYNICLDQLKVSKEHGKIIRETSKKESINLLAYIAIGYSKDNKFIILWERQRDRKYLILEKQMKISLPRHDYENLYIILVDIFGKKIYKKINID